MQRTPIDTEQARSASTVSIHGAQHCFDVLTFHRRPTRIVGARIPGLATPRVHGLGQITFAEMIEFCDCHRVVERVLQLTNVPGPTISEQRARRGRRQGSHHLSGTRRRLLQKDLGQEKCVVLSFA